MKLNSVALFFTAVILLGGCAPSAPKPSSDNVNSTPASTSENVPQSDSTNGTVNVNLNQKTDVFAPPVYVLDPTTCSENNPPRIVEGKGGNTLLNFCGKETGFTAYQLLKENYIIFTEGTWQKEKGEAKFTTKLVYTLAPYTETTLVENMALPDFRSPTYLLEKNLYVWTVEADGPGSLVRIFAFRPSDKAFLFYESECMGYACDVNVRLAGSLNSREFKAVRSSDNLPGECDDCILAESDVEVVINDKSYTKAEVKKGSVKDELPLFQCDELNRYSASGEVTMEQHLSGLLEDFPQRLPCRVFQSEKVIVAGFFDLAKNEFVRK